MSNTYFNALGLDDTTSVNDFEPNYVNTLPQSPSKKFRSRFPQPQVILITNFNHYYDLISLCIHVYVYKY